MVRTSLGLLCGLVGFVGGTIPGSGDSSSPVESPRVRWFSADDVAARRAGHGKPWLGLLNTQTLSVGRYALAAGEKDGQSPHDDDEIYHVVAGRGVLEADGEQREVAAGDTVFVAARVPHRFVEVTEDLDVLVFFSKAIAGTGGMAAGPKPVEQTPYPETSQRGSARIFYWFGSDSAGQVSIDYGQPRWNPKFASFLTQPSGTRWRFGENSWTTLDTNMPLEIGGVEVPVGAYYVVLEHTKADGVRMVLLDPDVVRTRRLDAYEAKKTSGGIAIPLDVETREFVEGRLAIELAVDRSKRDVGELEIRFGPYALSAAVRMEPRR